jgi:hypothetical protein
MATLDTGPVERGGLILEFTTFYCQGNNGLKRFAIGEKMP